MTAPEFLLEFESVQVFESFRDTIVESCQPEPGLQAHLVEELVAATWEFRRWRSTCARFWEYVGGHYNRSTDGMAQALFHCPEKHFRAEYRNRADAVRNYYLALDRWLKVGTRDAKKKSMASEWLLRVKELTDALAELPEDDAPDGSTIASDKMLSSS